MNGWVANHCQTVTLVMQWVRQHDPLHNRYLLQQWGATRIEEGTRVVSHSHCGAANNNWLTDPAYFCTCHVVCSPSLSLCPCLSVCLSVCLTVYARPCQSLTVEKCWPQTVAPHNHRPPTCSTGMPCPPLPFPPPHTQWTIGHLHFTLHAWPTRMLRYPTVFTFSHPLVNFMQCPLTSPYNYG